MYFVVYSRCINTGRHCDGYLTEQSNTVVPRTLAPTPYVESPHEPQALEFFFLRSAPQLSGFFGSAFFQGSILRLSLSEPSIRQAMAAIGALQTQSVMEESGTSKMMSAPNFHLQLYNRSIRAIMEKIATGPGALPLVAAANVLFICLEMLQGNIAAVEVHTKNGMDLVRTWRERNREPVKPWGQKYTSPEMNFMESEIVPLISLFNGHQIRNGVGKRANILLNPADDLGGPVLPSHFDTVLEAAAGIIDIYSLNLEDNGQENKDHLHELSSRAQRNFEQWMHGLDDLVSRQKHVWTKWEREVGFSLLIVKLGFWFISMSNRIKSECEWDAYRTEYEELNQLIESLFSEKSPISGDVSSMFALTLVILPALHAVAWKCRWPILRRRGLDLAARMPRREWIYETRHYHSIFSRIMEIEEAQLNLPPGGLPEENWVPPEHKRIHHFTVAARRTSSVQSMLYDVTFVSKPDGPDGPLKYFTEEMQFESFQSVGAVPIDMMSRI